MNGQTILITGGTGTFGTAFVRYLCAHHQPRRVIALSRDELKQAILLTGGWGPLRTFLGDVRDLRRLRRAFKGVDYVVHAAALKRVEVGEYNPTEVIKTNVQGTSNVIEAAIDCGVKRVVLLSSDKACQPVNLYGATKLVAEKLMLAAHVYAEADKTSFAVVRYGNVSGSRGSVIETWRQMALEQRSLMVTDPEATRFWMTVEEACRLVMYALKDAAPNSITVPRLPAYRLSDLCQAIAPGTPLHKVGLRQGEKLHEAMIGPDEVSLFGTVMGTDYLQAPMLKADPELRLRVPLTSDTARRLSVEDLKERLAKL